MPAFVAESGRRGTYVLEERKRTLIAGRVSGAVMSSQLWFLFLGNHVSLSGAINNPQLLKLIPSCLASRQTQNTITFLNQWPANRMIFDHHGLQYCPHAVVAARVHEGPLRFVVI